MGSKVSSDTGPFAIVPEWVLDAPISAQAVRLYALLSRYADTDGVAWPKRQALRLRMQVDSEKTVDRALRELVDVGAVEVEHTVVDGKRMPAPNRYHVRRSRPGVDTGVHVSEVGGVTDVPTVGSPMSPPPPSIRNERELMNESQVVSVHAVSTSTALAVELLNEHLAALDHRPPRAIIGATLKQVRYLLAEDVPVDHVRDGLELLRHKGLHPNALPSLVEEARANRRRGAPVTGGKAAKATDYATRYLQAADALEAEGR